MRYSVIVSEEEMKCESKERNWIIKNNGTKTGLNQIKSTSYLEKKIS